MKRRSIGSSLGIALGVFLAVAAIVPSVQAATIYYISTSGDNTTGDGSSGNPWRTFGKAMLTVTNQDSLYVGEGTYNETVTNNACVTVTFKGGFNTNLWAWTWDPLNHPSIVQSPSTNVNVFTIGKSTNSVIGFTITGGKIGISSSSSAGVNGVGAPQNTVANCIISYNWSHGIYIASKDGVIIRNCLIHHNRNAGIFKLMDNGSKDDILNCTIADNDWCGVDCDLSSSRTAGSLTNCIVTGNKMWGIRKYNNSQGATYVSDSCVWGNSMGPLCANYSAANTTSVASVIVLKNVISADPKYVGGGDYHLQAGSPCTGVGADLTSRGVTIDLENTARSAPYDMGCYKSSAGGASMGLTTYADASKTDDSLDGLSAGNAKKTIGAALAVTQEGGTCNVAAGTYNEQVFVSRMGQTLQGADWQTTIIQGTTNLMNGVHLTQTNTTIRNLTIQKWVFGVMMDGYNVTNDVIDHCIIRSNSSYGVFGQGDLVVVQDSWRIKSSIISNNYWNGIYCTDGKKGLTVFDTLIARNGQDGVCVTVDNSANGQYFVNCTIADNARFGFNNEHSFSSVYRLTNCIVSGNGVSAMNRYGAYIDLPFGSCFFGPGRGPLLPANVQFRGTGTAAGGGNRSFIADPKFVGNGDYHLSSSSPCIGWGVDPTPYGVVSGDLDGNSWAAPFDIGCYKSAYAPITRYATTYVDGGLGSDSAVGNAPGASAKKTINAGLSVAAAFGTCNVAAGNYQEQVLVPLPGQTLLGAGQATTTITTNGVSPAIVHLGDSNQTVRGFTIKGNLTQPGVYVIASDYMLGAGVAGPVTNSDLIDQCTIQSNMFGVYVYSWTWPPREQLAMSRCTVVNNQDSGVFIGYGSGLRATNCLIANNGGNGVYQNSDQGVQIHLLNCTIANSATNGLFVAHPSGYDTSDYLTNCIVTGSGICGLKRPWSASPTYLGYSLLNGNGLSNYDRIAAIVYQSGNITNQLPTFRAGGFQLAGGSYGIDSGTNIGVKIDLLGTARPLGLGYDMGCYEYNPPPVGTMIMLR